MKKSLHLLIERFVDAELEFVVIGGFPGMLHGSSCVTNGLDVCMPLTAQNFEKLRKALCDLRPVHHNAHVKQSFLEYPPAAEKLGNLFLETDTGVVGVFGNIPGLGDLNVLDQNAIEVPLFGRRCRVISLEDLIKAKEAMGREKDLLTAKELRAIAAKRAQAKES